MRSVRNERGTRSVVRRLGCLSLLPFRWQELIKAGITKNEVAHARAHADQMVLFILHGIEVAEGDGEPVAKGGFERILWPWDLDSGELTALQFMYEVPTARG